MDFTEKKASANAQPVQLNHLAPVIEASHLHSCYLPSATECAQVQRHLDEANLQLLHYNTEIDALASALEALRSQRDSLQDTIFSYRNVLSPMRSFPVEIWAHILALTMSVHHQDHEHDLTAVCVRWHEILCSTTSLWRDVNIDLTKSASAIQKQLQQHKQWSQNTPLSVTLHFPTLPSDYYHVEDEITLGPKYLKRSALLGPILRSLKSLPVVYLSLVNFNELWTKLMKYLNRNLMFPHLTSFEILGLPTSSEDNGEFIEALRVLTRSSELRRLSLSNLLPEHWEPQRFPNLWPHLQTVSLHVCAITVADDFLARAPNLTSLTITESVEPDEERAKRLPITHARLTHLSIEGRDISLLLATLTSPALISLEFNGLESSRTDLLVPFLRRSACRLHELKLLHVNLDDKEVLDVLRLTPHLRKLELFPDYPPFSAELYQSLAFSSLATEPLVPHLRALKVQVDLDILESILDMVSSRSFSHSGTNYVTILHLDVQLVHPRTKMPDSQAMAAFQSKVDILRRSRMTVQATVLNLDSGETTYL
ncbi:hypothetical protein C8J56DRAFT_48432 [Mycena floridula]|nr:hypothetical protein C8J56DRAFT_48432 [Mycena floridula]